ncbi:MAG: MBL fold metallo-hydrolase [Campylobacterales bacterium]
MQILSKPCGSYETNCYIAVTDKGELIIDPGQGAFEWIKTVVKKPLAILNTHGHFDHVWDNQKTKEAFNIPIFTPKKDVFMLENDIFGFNMPPSSPDVEMHEGEYEVGEIKFKYIEFAGHTPGCGALQIEGALFTGDFIFKGSIGRVDFPYSSPEDMKKSLQKFIDFDVELAVYPGHGPSSTVSKEKATAKGWMNYL